MTKQTTDERLKEARKLLEYALDALGWEGGHYDLELKIKAFLKKEQTNESSNS